MRVAVFMISASFPEAGVAELNRFLQENQVTSVRKEFVSDREDPFWSCWIEYRERPVAAAGGRAGSNKRIDYREVLNAEDFKVFAQLRQYRKQAAEKDAVPLFAVFSNEQLAEIARKRPASVLELDSIEGVGEARARKYFPGVQAVIEAAKNPVPG